MSLNVERSWERWLVRSLRAVRYGVFALFPALVLLGLMELGVRQYPARFTGPLTLQADFPDRGCFRPSLTLGYEPTPGTCGYDAGGFRLPSPVPTPPNALRVLLLGDSISTHVYWTQRLVAELEAATGRSIALWNTGVTGYDTCQEATVLREKGWATRPDLVLLQVCPNDLDGSPILVHLGDGSFRYYVNNKVIHFPGWLLHSHLLTYLALRGWTSNQHEFRNERITDYCARDIQGQVLEHKVPLVALHFPLLVSASAETRPERLYINEGHLVEMHKRDGLPVYSLRPVLEAKGALEQFRPVPQDHLHPNREAQEIVGTAVARYLVEKGLVSAKSSPSVPRDR